MSVKAVILAETELELAGERIRAGQLVSFPTETVYGLGANAFDEEALKSIFTTKQRPLSDPLIVHVSKPEEALELVDLPEAVKPMYCELINHFWPGPLTLVAKAKDCVPSIVSAGTGYVGIRMPRNPIAIGLLKAAGVPICAPSANTFGHVSPTTSSHVFNDLKAYPISIIHGECDCCQIGIESTVIRIEDDGKHIRLFRRGGISEKNLRDFLSSKGFAFEFISVNKKNKPTQDPEMAPGQLLTHYAPADCETFLVKGIISSIPETSTRLSNSIKESVILDFNKTLISLKDMCLEYKDLSESGSVEEAMSNIFDHLRWTESVEGVKTVLLPDMTNFDDHNAPALHDRMFRSASGRICEVLVDKSDENVNIYEVSSL
eukprot:TRINITY_DN243918_c1_g1_i1.p1 TRINITY_DN243918_c1_g1~~TRINITY_DN243918_c1_g1_i1.p1  ORF type:complete len:376 (-),score=105.60 TRINITY_DN243918_c1_g1_i1:71-1198(-)